MKKILAAACVILFMVTSFSAASSVKQETIKYETFDESLYFKKPVIEDAGSYCSVDWQQTDKFLEIQNKPRLPIITKQITFPLGTEIKDIEINCLYEEITLNKRVQLTNWSIESQPNSFTFNDSFYQTSSLFPKNPYFVSNAGGKKDREHVILLNIDFYTQYDPSSNILRFPKQATIAITADTSTAINYKNDTFDMVIIAPQEFSEKIYPFISHKNSLGVRTYLQTTEQIIGHYAGRDNAEQIKYFIKDAIEGNGIEYVFLIGDINHVPMRNTAIHWEHLFENTYSDQYYADIYDAHGNFSNWDPNDNQQFAEFNFSFSVNNSGKVNWQESIIEDIDLYSDINVGRILCANENEVEIILQKIIDYEQNLPQGPWYNRIILMGGTTIRWSRNPEGEEINSKVAESMSQSGFEPVFLWTSKHNFNPLSINKEISEGAGFISYSGHGFENGLMTYSRLGLEKNYQALWIKFLKNENRLPIIFWDACLTARPDVTVHDLYSYRPLIEKIITTIWQIDTSQLNPPIAMKFLLKDPGGAIASIGATRQAYQARVNGELAGGGAILSIKFFDSYESGSDVSSMLIEAQNKYLQTVGFDYLTIAEFMLLGDPSLKIA